MLKEYLIKYTINRDNTEGVAVVVANSVEQANSLLKTNGKFNGLGYTYYISTTTVINETDLYTSAAIIEESSVAPGFSAYELALQHGYVGSEAEWLDSLHGEIGEQGPQGPKGPKGDKGDTGARGERGAQGPQGPRGYQGEKGEKGEKGDTGKQGPQGPQGIQGPRGYNGANGTKGDIGPSGPQGPQGPKGEKGDIGPKGDKGDKGDSGLQGIQGPRGEQGPQGKRGPRGYTGNINNLCRNILHADLLEMRNSSSLSPGAFYRITDYCAIVNPVYQNNAQSANHPFDIIVQALDEYTLSEDAHAIQHEGDAYFSTCDLNAWKIKYSLENDTSRFSWGKDPARPQSWSCAWGVLESKQNSDASSGYETAPIEGKTKYLYRPAEPTSHLEGKQLYRDIVLSAITSPEGFVYEADSAPSYEYDEEMGESYYNYPSEIRVKTASGQLVATFINDYNNEYKDVNDDMGDYIVRFTDEYTEKDGLYYLTPEPELLNDWWENFIGGSIKETEREYYEGPTNNLYYAFDSALPKSSKSVTEVTDGHYLYKSDNTIDTITYTSYISDEDGGKGVIYQLIDEFGNDCSYDFKNIQFKDNGVYYYTFSASGNDASLEGTVRDNTLLPYSGKLLTTIFKGQAIGNKIQRVANSGPFVFEKSATYNDIRASHESAKISAKGDFDANVLLIRNELTTNGTFSNNRVQYLATKTTVNGDLFANQLDTLNRNNATLTVNCGRIQQCVIYGCGTFSIANTNGSTTGTMGYSTINLGMNGSNVKLLWNTTASLNNRIEGLNIKAYNWGTTEVPVNITNHPVNATYPLTIAKDKSGNVKMWCEADLV